MSEEEKKYVDGLYLVPVLNKMNPDLFKEADLPIGFFLLARKNDDIYSMQFTEREGKLYPTEKFFSMQMNPIDETPMQYQREDNSNQIVYNNTLMNNQREENTFQNVYDSLMNNQREEKIFQNAYNSSMNVQREREDKSYINVYNSQMNNQKDERGSFQNIYIPTQQTVQPQEEKKHRKNSYAKYLESINKQEQNLSPQMYKYFSGK